MMTSLPPLNFLRAFEASARHLSFTQAARELNLTQAGVSKQIKLLEQYLGEQLFVRQARSLELTRGGAAYLPKVRDAFDRLSEGTREVFGNRRSRVLTVRSAISFAVNWLGPRLGDFRKGHPDKPIRLTSSVWRPDNDGVQAIDHADLDIQYGASGWSNHRYDRLTRETIFPLCNPQFREKHVLNEPTDLNRHVLINVLGYEESWDVWLKAAGAHGGAAARTQQVDTSLMAFELAAHGIGIALGRSSLAQPELASGRLIKPFDIDVDVGEGFFLLSPKPTTEHPHAEAFRSWLIEQSHLV